METPKDEAGQSASTKANPVADRKETKVPQDLSKVSDAKARELIDAGLVEDADLPGKMYRRKSDRFLARIPNYTWNAYDQPLKDEWEEVTSEAVEAPE